MKIKKISLDQLHHNFMLQYPALAMCYTPEAKEMFCDIAVIYGHKRKKAQKHVLIYSLTLN